MSGNLSCNRRQQFFGFCVARKPSREVLKGLVHLSFSEALHLRSSDECCHIGPQDILRLVVGDEVLSFQRRGLVNDSQPLRNVRLEHLVHRCGQDGELVQCHPVGPQAVLEELAHLRRHPISHRRNRRICIPGTSGGLKAFDLPAVALVEQPVQCIARRWSCHGTTTVFWQSLEGDSKVVLELMQPLLGRLTVLCTEDLLQLFE
mmetsp:Transcript_35476/g.82807  ORF Transcript_35476/g.82807 Transcript_35476/m.82807 type:complete len:204 (-) Transcript_35476:197-808(-)